MSYPQDGILITGASSGIGYNLYQMLKKEGRKVTGCSRERVPEFPDMYVWDVRYPDTIGNSLFTYRTYSHIVHCAGVNYLQFIGALKDEDVREVLDTNIWGTINLLNHVRKHNACKNVILVSSVASTQPMRCSIAYNASKAAVDMIVKQAARELGGYHAGDMNIIGVRPGFIEGTRMSTYAKTRCTEIRGQNADKFDEYQKQYIPKGRYPTMKELMQVFHWLLSDKAPLEALSGSFVTVGCGQG